MRVSDRSSSQPGLRLRRILCAARPDPSSRCAIEWAAWLAAVCDADVRLFHAVDGAPAPSTESAEEYGADRLLNALFAQTRGVPGRLRVSAAVTLGEPSAEIARHARMVRADLIVVAVDRLDDETVGALSRIAHRTGQPVMAATSGSDAGERCQPGRVDSFLCPPVRDAASEHAVTYARAIGRATGVAVRTAPDCADDRPFPAAATTVLVAGVGPDGPDPRVMRELTQRDAARSLLLVPDRLDPGPDAA